MDTNNVSIDAGGCETLTDGGGGGGTVPEPSTASLLLLIGAPALLWLRRLKFLRK
jgi:hypothetical protein